MCLTKRGYQERTWGPYPALRRFLEDKSLSWRYYVGSSASDHIFERLPRVLEIGLLTCDNREEICNGAADVGWDALHRDLEALARQLDDLAQLLHETAHEVRTLHSPRERRRSLTH